MNDLVILHLSDLHIDSTLNSYSRLLKGLLRDIKKEISYVPDKSVVVVVTGDTIHKGDPKAISNAVSFFKDLYEILGNKVVSICIVPGNHDKARTTANKFLIPAYRNMDKGKRKFDESFFDIFWKYQKESYSHETGSGYVELTKKIYSIFGLTDPEDNFVHEKTFGTKIIEVLGKQYCFVMLNTAWSCIDDNDTRQLILGEFQINEILRQYHKQVDELGDDAIKLTFVLGHHPIGALYGSEEDALFSKMISFEELNANAYLCGHTHDRTVINWVNNRHSINTFMTGIGWPESDSGYHIGSHTYSMYVFNLDANSIDIYVRSTDDGGTFSPDYRIYTNETDKTQKKLIFPIKAQESQTYIALASGPERTSKAYYISDNFLKYMKEYVIRIARLRQSVGIMIESDKSDFYEELLYEENNHFDEVLYNYFFADVGVEIENSENEDTIKEIFSSNTNLQYYKFWGFLQRVCQKMEKLLLYDQLDSGDIVRFHFRYLADRTSILYLPLCVSFPDEINPLDYELSPIKYGELIEAAYSTGRGLVYSVNKDFCPSGLKEKWKNFLTGIPLFDGNNFKRKYAESTYKNYPFITFGVTTNNEKFDPLLYCMDYFAIDKMLEEIINTYIKLFHIDINKFCEWVKNEKKEEKTHA